MEKLREIGRLWQTKNIDEGIIIDDTHLHIVNNLYKSITKEIPRSLLITGEQGVGKSTLIQIIIKRLLDDGWTVFEATAGDVMAGQTYIGQIEEQVKDIVDILSEEKKRVWIAPQFHELFYTGRYKENPTGILDLMLPHIETGKLIVIGETQLKNYEWLVQRSPKLKRLLEVSLIEAESQEATVELTEHWINRQNEANRFWDEIIDKKQIKEIASLARQYFTYYHEPGNVFDFVKRIQDHFEEKETESSQLSMSDVYETLSALTGLPINILSDAESLNVQELKQEFHKRVVGQEEAVNLIIERIAMIKAGLTDPTRPLGVFLFVGPTGTGKTEIAKTLTEYLFGTDERMIRLDMSEFQGYDSISRITGDGSDYSDSSALVNLIRQNPFSVILLDEFEKAHRNIWDIFLQVFDDGRLTDQRGSVADFRNCIIIMTSNLGSIHEVERYTPVGFNAELREEFRIIQPDLNEELFSVFRPEFINRIDRIVQFRPLSKTTMRQILKMELGKVLKRRGLRRQQWAVEWESSAIEFLLERGFSETLGARPMKRAIDQYLLAPLAMTIVQHQFPKGDQFLFVKCTGDKLKVDFVDPDAPQINWQDKQKSIETQKEKAQQLTLKEIIYSPKGNLAEREAITSCFNEIQEGTQGWENEKAEILESMTDPDFWESADRHVMLSKVEYFDRFGAALASAKSLLERIEDTENKQRTNFSIDVIQRLAELNYLLHLSYKAFTENKPQDAFIRVSIEAQKDSPLPLACVDFAENLIEMYRKWIKKRRMSKLLLHYNKEDGKIEWIMAVAGFGAYSILEKEHGFHVWEMPQRENNVTRYKIKVEIAPQPEGHFDKKEMLTIATNELDKAGFNLPGILRRYREKPNKLVKDHQHNWRTGRLERVLDGDFDLFEG